MEPLQEKKKVPPTRLFNFVHFCEVTRNERKSVGQHCVSLSAAYTPITDGPWGRGVSRPQSDHPILAQANIQSAEPRATEEIPRLLNPCATWDAEKMNGTGNNTKKNVFLKNSNTHNTPLRHFKWPDVSITCYHCLLNFGNNLKVVCVIPVVYGTSVQTEVTMIEYFIWISICSQWAWPYST